jgi:hypothetical protein
LSTPKQKKIMALTQTLLATRFVDVIAHMILNECFLGRKTCMSHQISAGHFELTVYDYWYTGDQKILGYKRHVQMLRLHTSKYVVTWNNILEGGCRGGHVDIVELALKKGARGYDTGLYLACINDHRKIADILISKSSIPNWDSGLRGACKGGHRELAELMISKGATACNDGLYFACLKGHRALADVMILRGATNFNFGLYGAREGGHHDVAEWMISKGATEFEGQHTFDDLNRQHERAFQTVPWNANICSCSTKAHLSMTN